MNSKIPFWSWFAVGVAAVGLMAAAAACGGTSAPTSPSSTPPQTTPPPVEVPVEPSAPAVSAPNAPPVIKAVYMSSSRVEADEKVSLAADVQDQETPIDQLTYEWTSNKGAGTFTGSGRQVKWQAPHLQKTPDTYVLTLTVIERYSSEGETRENRTSSSVSVHYNDSYREIRDMSLTFLGDFSTYSVSPETCVRNFSDSCPGRADELGDIRANRRDFIIQSGTFSVSSITLDEGKTAGTATLPCQFTSIKKSTGLTETATGTCIITGTYDPEQWHWWLCDSGFRPASSKPAMRGLAP
jgi:hypothetical protein